MSENLIDRAWDVFDKHQRERGQTSDDVSFIGGFMSCFGVLTGRVDVGMPPDTSVMKMFELVQKNLDEYRGRVIRAQAEERRNGG